MKLLTDKNWVALVILLGLIILDTTVDFIAMQTLKDRVEVLEELHKVPTSL